MVAPAQNSPAAGAMLSPVELEDGVIGELLLLDCPALLPAGGITDDDAPTGEFAEEDAPRGESADEDTAFRTGVGTLPRIAAPLDC